jgi:hypothetical protein
MVDELQELLHWQSGGDGVQLQRRALNKPNDPKRAVSSLGTASALVLLVPSRCLFCSPCRNSTASLVSTRQQHNLGLAPTTQHKSAAPRPTARFGAVSPMKSPEFVAVTQ